MLGQVDHLSNVYVEPYHRKEKKFYGGIDRSAQSDFGRMSTRRGLFRDIPPGRPRSSEPEKVTGKFLYAGPIWNHFGHVMVDSVHRLWAHDDHDGIVFAGVYGLGPLRVPTFLPEISGLIGIHPKQIMLLRKPAVFERLDVPSPGIVWGGNIQPFYRPFLRRYQDEIERQIGEISVPAKLYYSRRHLLNRGGILGCSYFEEVLSENGFTVVRPEELEIVEQFAHVLKSEQLVFDEGSAIHLTEVLNEVPPKTYMLPRRSVDNIFQQALNQRGHCERLASPANISLLRDRRGALSTAALGFYPNPQAVFDRMKELRLVEGSFDQQAYWSAVLNELKSCPAETAEIEQSRLDELSTARQRLTLDREPEVI